MELVFQTTHLAVARPRLKVGVERERVTPLEFGRSLPEISNSFCSSFSYTEVMHTRIIQVENESLHSKDK